MDSNERLTLRRKAIGDLRAFVDIVEKEGNLVHIEGADPDKEIGAIYELSLEHLYPPTLLFSKMKGCDPANRIIMNVRTSKFMVGNLDMDAVRDARKRAARKSVEPIEPRLVNTGPVLENVIAGDNIDIFKFPAPIWHADDGGPYLGTECLVITKDPDSDWVNVGTYRVQMQDKKTVTIFIEPGKHGDIIRRKYWERGEHCPFVVTFGQAPVLGGVSRVTFGTGVSEFAQAGGQLGRPIDIVKGQVTGIPIPADAEVAFEGFMPPVEEDSRMEGPFGEWPGYYSSGSRPEPVLRIERIYHRNNPIVIGQPPVRPVLAGRHTHIAGCAALWDSLEAAGVPGVEGVWKMSAGGTRFANVIAIRQQHAGHAKMAGLVATGAGTASYMGRITIIVDEDIDITNDKEVMWALATRWDPRTQTDIVDGCYTGHIDPVLSPDKRESGDLTSSRIIIYAVRPYHWKDDFPKVNKIEKAYAEEVRAKWQEKLPFLAKPKR